MPKQSPRWKWGYLNRMLSLGERTIMTAGNSQATATRRLLQSGALGTVAPKCNVLKSSTQALAYPSSRCFHWLWKRRLQAIRLEG